jgi:hypothetical protein
MACVDCWRWLWLLSFDKGGKVPKGPNWKVRPNPSLPLTRRTLLGGLMAAPFAAQSMRGALYAYVAATQPPNVPRAVTASTFIASTLRQPSGRTCSTSAA